MNLIFDTTLAKWKSGRRTKLAPSGWESGNAVCCEHRGQTPDKRGRGGIIISSNTLSYSCFNCGFRASYQAGKPLYPKFLKLLAWLNVDENTINQLKLESLRISKESGFEPVHHVRRNIKPIDMPECVLLENNMTSHLAHIDFLKSRGFAPDDFSFLVSSDIVYRSRVMIPFILHDTIIGYSARSIVPTEKLRYIMKMTTDFVFGMEWIQPEHEWVFVTEGLFDALSVKCLGVMHNEISDVQEEMICDLPQHKIVVPDLDKAGLAKSGNSLIDTAIDCGWSVSFPEWDVKDINAAYVKYGQLFVVKHLLETKTDNVTTIRLKQKLLMNKLKTRK
jgi:hypothetical protein